MSAAIPGIVALSLGIDDGERQRLMASATQFAALHELSENERARLLIVLDELFTNIVDHGFAERDGGGTIDVVLGVAAGQLTIDIADDGALFDPLVHPLPDLDLPAERRPIGGLGILIWRSLVDEARYRNDDGRNRLSLTRRIADPCSDDG